MSPSIWEMREVGCLGPENFSGSKQVNNSVLKYIVTKILLLELFSFALNFEKHFEIAISDTFQLGMQIDDRDTGN